MNYAKICLLIFLTISTNLVYAQKIGISLERTKFLTYYQDPVTEKSPATIAVVFYKNKPTPKQVGEFLRKAIATATIIEIKNDIVASAFYSSTGNEEDEEILAFENTTALLYKSSDKTIKPMSLTNF